MLPVLSWIDSKPTYYPDRSIGYSKSTSMGAALRTVSTELSEAVGYFKNNFDGYAAALYWNWFTLVGYINVNKLIDVMYSNMNSVMAVFTEEEGGFNNIVVRINETIENENSEDSQRYSYILTYNEMNPDNKVSAVSPTEVPKVNATLDSESLTQKESFELLKPNEYRIYESSVFSMIEKLKTTFSDINACFSTIKIQLGVIDQPSVAKTWAEDIIGVLDECTGEMDSILTYLQNNASSILAMDLRVFNLTNETFNFDGFDYSNLSKDDFRAIIEFCILTGYSDCNTEELKSIVSDWLGNKPSDAESFSEWLLDGLDEFHLDEGIKLSIVKDYNYYEDIFEHLFEDGIPPSLEDELGNADDPTEQQSNVENISTANSGSQSGGNNSSSSQQDPPPAVEPEETQPETPEEKPPEETPPEETPPEETPPEETPPEETPPEETPPEETPPTDDPGTTEPDSEIGGESDWEAVPDDEGNVQEPEVNTGEDTFTPPEETGDTTVTEPNSDGTEPLPDANGDVQQPEVGDTGTTEGDTVTPAPEEGEPLPDANGDVQQPEIGDTGTIEGDIVSPASDAGTVESGNVTSDVTSTVTDTVTDATTDTGVAELNSNVLENDSSIETMMPSDDATSLYDLNLDNVDPLDVNPVLDDFNFDDMMEGIDDKIGFDKVEIPKFDGDIPLPTDPTITDM